MPRLVIKQGDGVGRDQVLGGHACVVGRDPAADFTVDDTVVSRRHFQILPESGAYWLEDLGSTNGTLVNGRRAQRVQLMDGDVISVGTTQLAFVQKDLLGGGSSPKRPPVVARKAATPERKAPTRSAAPTPRRRRRRR